MGEVKKHTAAIGRKTYAVGLAWNIVAQGEQPSSIARETAHRIGADFIAIHTSMDGTLEYALGAKLREHQPGMEALASSIITGRPGSWSAIFRLPTGEFYVVSSRNGAIEPQSDRVFDNLNSAHECITDINPTREGLLYAEPSININGFRPWSIEDALKTAKTNAKMTDVNLAAMLRRRLVLAGLIGVIGCGGWGAYTYIYLDAPLPVQVTTQHIPAAPWINKQAAGEELSDCLDVIERLPMVAPGWKPTSIVCSGGSATVAFTRSRPLESGGIPIEWFQTSIINGGWPQKGLGSNGKDVASYTLPLPRPRTYWTATTKTPTIAQTATDLSKGLDRLFVSSTKSNPSGKFYSLARTTIETNNLPRRFIPLFNSIIGTTLDSVKLSENGKYTIAISNGEAIPPKQNIQFVIDQPAAPRGAVDPDFANFYANIKK